MLEPGNRTLLLDALRPPPGYELDLAVGTSYTLDLHALLMAPLAFAMFAWEQDDEDPTLNVIASLEAVRRYADRIHVFTQSGGIAVPPEYRTLVAYLEDTIHEVTAPQGGIFHPKVWVLRFRETNDSSFSYRMLCLSRNLTFDRSWDTVLSLEGSPSKEPTQSGPVADFVRSLPSLALQPVPPTTTDAIEQLASELRAVTFEPPEGFDELRFLPLGLARHTHFPVVDGGHDRLVCVSPFITAGTISRLAKAAQQGLLISRPESLARLGSAALNGFEQLFVLNDDAQPTTEDSFQEESDRPPIDLTSELAAEESSIELLGLHAKIYVADNGERSTVWVGSANATDAALHTNVEFMVELTGPKDRCGIEVLLGAEDKEPSFGTLLLPYLAEDQPKEATELEQAFEELDQAARLIAGLGWRLEVSEETTDLYELAARAKEPVPEQGLGGLSLRCWPISLRREVDGRHLRAGEDAITFGSFSFDRITPFLGFELSAPGLKQWPKRFVVRAELVGAPVDRKKRLVGSLLKNAADFLIYLRFLLSDPSDSQTTLEDLTPSGNGEAWAGMFGARYESVLEPMLKALSSDPSRLDHIASLINDLQSTDDGISRIPTGFLEVWNPIWSVRSETRL